MKQQVRAALGMEQIPAVGVSPHDLRFLAETVARGFGCCRGDATAEEITCAAITQATFDLEAIAEALGENCEHYHAILSVKERLWCAAETASILVKLLATVPPTDQREAAE